MSLECYEIAYEIADKIIKCLINQKVLDNHESRQNGVMINPSSLCISNANLEPGSYAVYISNRVSQIPNLIPDNSYIVFDNRDYFTTKLNENPVQHKLTDCREFDEGFDFQLQTKFNDNELMQYYIFCLVKMYGFDGMILRRIGVTDLDIILAEFDRLFQEKNETV